MMMERLYQIVFTIIEQVMGLAVDWVSRNLYWTDATFNWIGISPLNDKTVYRFIVTENLFSPHGIGVHPQSR
jgi:hypothetical protein